MKPAPASGSRSSDSQSSRDVEKATSAAPNTTAACAMPAQLDDRRPRREVDRSCQRTDAGRRHQPADRTRIAAENVGDDDRHEHVVRHPERADGRDEQQTRAHRAKPAT